MRLCKNSSYVLALMAICSVAAMSQAAEPETPREAAARIAELYRAEKWADAQTATKALMRQADDRFAAATLGLLLNDANVPGRASLVSDIGAMRFRAAVPHLVDRLEDSDVGVRQWSAIALGQIGDKTAAPFIARHLKTIKEEEKYRVRLALAHLGTPYVGYYVDGLRDRGPERRYWSSVALGELKDARSVPALLKRLDSQRSEDVLNARRALSAITGVRDADEIGRTKNADGSTSTSLRFRPIADFRKDIETWVAGNREAVTRAIEPPAEKWDFTKEPELPGLGISFAMSPAEVKGVLEKAGIKYEHHAEIKPDPPRTVGFSPEQIAVVQQPGFKRIWDVRYVFEHGRLESVHFMSDARDRDLADLKGPFKLKSDGIECWTGLDGAIRIGATYGDSEKTAYTIALNYRPN